MSKKEIYRLGRNGHIIFYQAAKFPLIIPKSDWYALRLRLQDGQHQRCAEFYTASYSHAHQGRRGSFEFESYSSHFPSNPLQKTTHPRFRTSIPTLLSNLPRNLSNWSTNFIKQHETGLRHFIAINVIFPMKNKLIVNNNATKNNFFFSENVKNFANNFFWSSILSD